MQVLQVRIEAILRIAGTVFGQRRALLAAGMDAHPLALGIGVGVFLDVVAEKDAEIRILLRRMAIAGEVAVFVMRAGEIGEAELVAAMRRQGLGAADGAVCGTRREAVPVRAARL